MARGMDSIPRQEHGRFSLEDPLHMHTQLPLLRLRILACVACVSASVQTRFPQLSL